MAVQPVTCGRHAVLSRVHGPVVPLGGALPVLPPTHPASQLDTHARTHARTHAHTTLPLPPPRNTVQAPQIVSFTPPTRPNRARALARVTHPRRHASGTSTTSSCRMTRTRASSGTPCRSPRTGTRARSSARRWMQPVWTCTAIRASSRRKRAGPESAIPAGTIPSNSRKSNRITGRSPSNPLLRPRRRLFPGRPRVTVAGSGRGLRGHGLPRSTRTSGLRHFGRQTPRPLPLRL